MNRPLVYEHARPAFLTVQAFAEHFAVSKMTVYRLINDGFLRAHRIRGSMRIPLSEVQRFKKSSELKWGES